MPHTFAETLRTLDSERRAGVHTLMPALALLAFWLAWAAFAKISVLAESTAASFESLTPPLVLAAPSDGIVQWAASLALGQEIRTGQLLFVLDAASLRTRLAALYRRRAALGAEIDTVAAQQVTARLGRDEENHAGAAAAGELAARLRQAESISFLADQVRTRSQRLASAGLVSAADAARAKAEADQQHQAAEAAESALAARSGHDRADLADRRAGVHRLDQEAARLREELATLDGDVAALISEIALRTVRAPASGRLASGTPVPPGSRIARGARVATLIPATATAPRILAVFPAPAAPALHPGQRAWVHLAASPAAPAALLRATVAAIAPMPRATGGGWEVALALSPDAGARSPSLRAGLPCSVEVEIARRTPAELLLAALRQDTAPPQP